MAWIDHTCLYWIDGKPSNYDDVKEALEEYGLYWTRDGVVYSKDKENVVSTATSYDPDSLVYRERYLFFKKLWDLYPPKFIRGAYYGTLRFLNNILTRLFPAYKDYDRVYTDRKFKRAEVFIQTEHQGNLNISFVTIRNHGIVILGGYGHFINPYTHFMDRGYGDEFERKMHEEAYDWCLEQLRPMLFFLFCKGWKTDEYNQYQGSNGLYYVDLDDLIRDTTDYRIFSGTWHEYHNINTGE